MTLAIRKFWREFLAVLGLMVLAAAVAVYILGQQGFRFPLVEAAPKHISIELTNAQAVEPGQGQTVRVAGIEVGRISGVKLENGIANVDVELDHQYDNLIREDATALLRPKTALKDMFIEVSPGTGRVVPEGGHISAANTLPDVNPDEILGSLDSDTRPYLKLLISGAWRGAARARRRPARGVQAPRARAPRPGPRHARDRRAPGRAEAAHPPLRAADDRAGAPPGRPAPVGQRVAFRVRHAREPGAEHLDVGRASCPAP